MFKKDQDISSNSQNLLKNKEIKKLKKDLCLQWPRTSADQLDALFSSSRVSTIKLESRTIIYNIDDIPHIFDVEVSLYFILIL